MKKTALALLAMACAVGAPAEKVLRIIDTDPSTTSSKSDHYATKNYAFADKVTTSVTVAIWVKDMKGTYFKFIAGVSERWSLRILHTANEATNRKLAFCTESGNALASGYVLNDGKWHFLVGTFNYDSGNAANSFQRLYVDGVLAAELTEGITAISTPGRAFSLGGEAQSLAGNCEWYQDIEGYFAELSVWNRALTAAEVGALFQKTTRLGGNESGLVAYWPLTGEPGMVGGNGNNSDYKFANVAAADHLPKLELYFGAGHIEDAEDFTLPFVRCVASPEWCAEHNYVQAENATGRSWADPVTNLVDVAAAAVSHERILCSPGTHRIESQMSPLVKYFYLGSCDPATGEPCREAAIIDAQEKCRHFISDSTVTGVSDFTIENLTFVNGRESGGGSMRFRVRIGKINNCIFHDNISTNGSGGAIYSYTANGTVVSNCQFYGNDAKTYGGAVYTQQNSELATDNLRFYDCVFTNNNATAGGGVYAERSIRLENCLLADNFATNGAAGITGVAGLLGIGSRAYIKNCLFTGKCKASYGQCINVRGPEAVVTNCMFRNVEGQGGTYGFIHFNSSRATFVDCVFTNNVNTDALFFPEAQTDILVRQCLIANNASGKAVIRDWKSSSRFENCTIINASFDSKDTTWCTNVVVNCILPNATVSSKNAFCNILSNCCVAAEQGGPFDSNVFVFDPLFKDAEHGDYTLKRYSPCREKGIMLDWMTADSLDLARQPRVVDDLGVPFSVKALPDLGCYEIQDFVRGTILSFK